jgi:ADP-ribose pyrophosphatase YjhB (NUDIX family)
MIKIRILKEQQMSDAEQMTIDNILGEKSVVSFDFDNTLVKSFPDFDEDGDLIYVNGGSNATMIRLMSDLIDDPSKKVYLVTSRNQEADERVPETSIETMLNKLNLSPDGFFYTNGDRKVTKLKELGVQLHFDDDPKEHEAIKGSEIQVFYPDDFLEDTMNVSKVVAVTLDNRILLLKRTDTGEFDIPGGHGKEGETAEYTAIRETQEETALELYNLQQISSKQVKFQGRQEQITYLSARLNGTFEEMSKEINLDTNENTNFYFVEPRFIDDFMGDATQNLKNMGNYIKSLTLDEQTEPFQKKMAAGYSKKKKIMIGLGKNKYKASPYNRNPSYERAKSAPPGFGGSLEESMDSLLAEIEFDLSKLVMKDELSPLIWKNKRLKGSIRQKLLQIAEDFIEGTPIEGRIEDITFTGSLAGYNYHDESDIDLHLLVDFDEDDEILQKLMNAIRINWNDNHDIFIEGHEVEIYVQDANEKHYSAGVYSISDDKWLVEPEKEEVLLDYDAIVNKAQGLSDEIDAISVDFEAGRLEKVQKSVERLREKMKKMRSSGLEDEGIYSVENLAFKLLRNSGQIGKLMNLGNDSYDSSMSIGKKHKIRVTVAR